MDSMLDRRALLKPGVAGAAALVVPIRRRHRTGQAQARRHPHHRPEPRRRYALSRPVHRVVGHRDQSPALRRPGAPRLPDEDPARARRAAGRRRRMGSRGPSTSREERQVPLRRAAHRAGREGPFRPLDRPKGGVPDAREGGQPGRETRVVDEHTVVCKLKNPTLVFLNNVSQTEWFDASLSPTPSTWRSTARTRASSPRAPTAPGRRLKDWVEGRPDGAGAPRRLCLGLARL